MIDKCDFWSAFVNAIGFVVFLIMISLFLSPQRVSDTEQLPIILAYTIILLAFWPIQILYHALITPTNEMDVLRRIDRGSMLFLIAAIFTPILWKFNQIGLGMIFIAILWIGAIVGMGMLLFIKNLSRKLTPILGFIIGIIGIIGVLLNIQNLSTQGQTLFLLGALFIILGGIVYAVKKPDIIKDIFGFHEVYHTLNLIGCIFLHFLIQSLF